MAAPSESRVMESGSPRARRATSWRRVSSPRAAKTGAECESAVLSLMRKVGVEGGQLLGPSFVIVGEGGGALGERHTLEAGLDDRYFRAAVGIFQTELDLRRRLVRVGGRPRIPAPREASLRDDLLDHDGERDSLARRVGGRHVHGGAGGEFAFGLD